MTIKTNQLMYGSVLKYSEENAYVVTAIHQKPTFIEGSPTPHFRRVGFTLFDTRTLTNREVTDLEMQQQLNEETVTLFFPQTVRRISMA